VADRAHIGNSFAVSSGVTVIIWVVNFPISYKALGFLQVRAVNCWGSGKGQASMAGTGKMAT